MTWHELRLSARPAALSDYMQLRFILFLVAWALISVHWFSLSALPFEAALAAVVLWHAVHRERKLHTTEAVEQQLRLAEERYRSLVETLPLATYVDRPGQVTGAAWVSPQIAEITSYAADEWTADASLLSKLLHPDDRDRVLAEMRRVKETGEPLEHEYRLLRRDDNVVWIHDSAVTVDVDGVRFTRGFIVDVTERREAKLELERQNERLRELDRLKDEFVALVSHELRTPLTSIRGYLELMNENDNLTEEQLRFLETIERNAQRLQRVVGDLLFVAQVEAGKLALEEGTVDIAALLDDAVQAARPAADAKGVAVRCEPAAVPAIAGDRARLAQVLDNFISNAVKFTPGGGHVLVRTTRHEHEIEITISDTGMGIPAHELPQLFQRFFRTERATAEAVPGTGLGLTIAKAIVDGHGGRIVVESEAGRGTTFHVFLPVASGRSERPHRDGEPRDADHVGLQA